MPHSPRTHIPAGFAAKAAAGKHRFYGLSFTPDDRPKEYYFLLVDPAKEKAFLRAMEGSELVNLRDYGTIVASGFGEAPESLKLEMQSQYGQ